MARKFNPANIITPNKARLRGDSFTHINSAWDEMSEDLMLSIVKSYTTNDVVILHGCVVSGTIGPGTAAVTAGAIFYNGRIYKVDANASITTTAPQTLVWTIAETLQGGQTTFSDGNAYDFQVIEKFVLGAGLSGSGIANYNGATVKQYYPILQVTQQIFEKTLEITGWDMDTDATKSVAHGLTDITKVRGMEVIIRNDAGTIISTLQGDIDNNGASDAYINYIDTSNVAMTRVAAGAYDTVDYNGAGTRGWIKIKYTA